MKLEEKLESLKKQLKQTETLYIKLEGAIEIISSLIEEKSSKKKGKK
jgi:hypothetical protein